MAILAITSYALAAPVKLPSGIVLDLGQEQVDDIKNQPGVFYGAKRADMVSPGDVVVSLPDELGGGYLYGRPEHLAKGFSSRGSNPGDYLGGASVCKKTFLFMVLILEFQPYKKSLLN